MDAIQLLLIAAGLTFGLFIVGFWIWMLVDCIRNEPSEGNDKIVWLIVIVATKLLGALIYYFVRRPERMRMSSG